MTVTYNRNDHNVYILGAGFSAAAGLPVVRGFLNETRDCQDWLRAAGRTAEVDAIEELLKFRLEAASSAERMHIDLENIEELFSLASASKGERLSESMIRSIAATLEYSENKYSKPRAQWDTTHLRSLTVVPGSSTKIPAHWTAGPHVNIDGRSAQRYDIPLYDALVGLMCGYFRGTLNQTNTMISFNYDLVVEEALRRLGIGYTYGFSGRAVDYRVPDLEGHNGYTGLLKLHGSVNWAYPGERGKSLTVFKSVAEVQAGKLVPFLVPPTWKKSFGEALTGVWDSSVEAITNATRIIIVGYSMPTTDTHFRYLLAAGLQKNASLRSIVVIDNNPKKGEVEERLYGTIRRELFDRGLVTVHPGAATDLWDDVGLSGRVRREVAEPFTCRLS